MEAKMDTYYILKGFAQYGADNYGSSESVYGDDTNSNLVNTGYAPLPGILIGSLLIIASLILLFKRQK